LAARLPSVDQVRFANSGTEAVMMALKAARAHTGRPKIAKCEGAYHGSYDYAEVSLDPTPEQWGPQRAGVVAYAKGTPGKCAGRYQSLFPQRAEAAVLIREHGRGLPAWLVDPIARTAAGLCAADQAYLERAAQGHAPRSAALLIFERGHYVRLGYQGAQGIWNIDPDLTTLEKSAAAGFRSARSVPQGFNGVFDPRPGKPARRMAAPSPPSGDERAGIAAMQLLDEPPSHGSDSDGIGQHIFRRAFRISHRHRRVATPLFRRRIEADLGIVIEP